MNSGINVNAFNPAATITRMVAEKVDKAMLERMKAVAQVKALQDFAKPRDGYERTSLVVRWALTQLTGEQFPISPPRAISPGLWFLEPVGAEK